MKIAVYSPYLDTAAGGEKYMLTIAEVLSKQDQVDILLDQRLNRIGAESIRAKNEAWHGLDLSNANFVLAPMESAVLPIKKVNFFRSYDWLFLNSDGSFFWSGARRNVLHFQLPVDLANKGVLGKFKLKSWQQAIYNSKFTQSYIEKQCDLKGEVIYPPVDVTRFNDTSKKSQILSVGRFVEKGSPKKQEVLIEMFKKLIDQKKMGGWTLHLAGGLMQGNEGYLEQLRYQAQGYSVVFHPNIEFDQLNKLYEESKIYWHAMGYGEDDPKNFEHFGISTVEAMAAGVVPVVIKKGGQIEIVEHRESGFLWDTIDECLDQTQMLIEDANLIRKISDGAKARAKKFSKIVFEDRIKDLVYGH